MLLSTMRSTTLAVACILTACGPPAANIDARAANAPHAGTGLALAPPAPPEHPGFEPDRPLITLPAAGSTSAEPCRVADIDLGKARDVVTEGASLYPISIAFGPKGGLAVW